MKKIFLTLSFCLAALSAQAKPFPGGAGICQCIQAPCDCNMPTPSAPIEEGKNGVFTPKGCKDRGGTPEFSDKPGGCMMDAGVIRTKGLPTR